MSRSGKGPDFLSIGPPKTATNWIYASLASHPEVSMPPIKEIRYLWAKQFLAERSYLSRFSSDHWYFRVFRAEAKSCVKAALGGLARGRGGVGQLAWSLRYALLPHSDGWYDALFAGPRLSGDVTPKYCELPAAAAAALAEQYPHLRIIVSLRDPVEREWSRAKMNLCKRRGRRLEDVPRDEWIQHFEEPAQAAANDYVELIERWSRQFGSERVLVVYLDEVLEDAWTAFCRICAFLDVSEPPASLRERAREPRNVGLRDAIPKELETYLVRMHRERIEALVAARPADPYPGRWLARVRSEAPGG